MQTEQNYIQLEGGTGAHAGLSGEGPTVKWKVKGLSFLGREVSLTKVEWFFCLREQGSKSTARKAGSIPSSEN